MAQPSSPAPRSRRRGPALEQAILRAAVDELTKSGYAGLSMDRVARRAGTNKNAIYRRWPSRAALGAAAYRQLVSIEQELPNTGRLRGDALAVLRGVNRESTSAVGSVLRSLLSSVGDDSELLAQLREQAADATSTTWLTLLDRAVARGEIAPETLHSRVATVAIDLLRNEYITRGISPLPDSVVVELVDEVYLPLLRGRGSHA